MKKVTMKFIQTFIAPCFALCLVLCLALCLNGLVFAQSDSASSTDPPNAAAQSALFRVAELGQTDAVSELLKQGADINAKNEKGETALMLAAKKGHAETVKALLDLEADRLLQANSGETALTLATRNGHLSAVRAILDSFRHHASINLQNQDGKTALMLSIENGRSDIASALIDARANPNLRDKGGVTALRIAVESQNHVLIRKLLELGASPFTADNDGVGAIHVAIEMNDDIAIALISNAMKAGKPYIEPYKAFKMEFRGNLSDQFNQTTFKLKFSNGTKIRLRNGVLVSLSVSAHENEELQMVLDVLERYSITTISRGVKQSEEEVEKENEELVSKTKKERYDFNLLFIVDVSHLTIPEKEAIIEDLYLIRIVEDVHYEGKIELTCHDDPGDSQRIRKTSV